MFDKVARHFYDDTCVVPEKAEGVLFIFFKYFFLFNKHNYVPSSILFLTKLTLYYTVIYGLVYEPLDT